MMAFIVFNRLRITFLAFLMLMAFPVMAFEIDENWAKCLQKNECNECERIPDFKNPSGYLGFYQMGANYASEVICTKPGDIPKMPGQQYWDIFKRNCVLNQWALDQGIKNFDDWTKGGSPPNPALAKQRQYAMLMKKTEANWKYIERNYSQYIGQTINGVTMTKETMTAIAHHVGPGGPPKGLGAVLQGEQIKDGAGTGTLGYAACLAGCLGNGGEKRECTFVVKDLCKGK